MGTITELKTAEIEHKRLKEALRKTEEQFRSFLDNLGDVAYTTDSQGNITYVNKMAEKLTGISLEDIIRRPFLPLFTKESQKIVIDVYQRTLNGESSEYEVTFTNGRIGHFKNEPLRDKDGKIIGVFGIARDITERKQAEKALKESEERYRRLYERMKDLAQKDPLTDLYNHRRINELLEYEIERSKRGSGIFSIMMLDVNDLKLINDTYGHIAGNRLLKNVAFLLKSTCRSIDLIGRYGGDEFLVILPYTDGEKAKSLAERISQQMKENGLKIDKKIDIPIRLSIGTATYPYERMIASELVALADKRMYESKRSGRSTVSAGVSRGG